LVKSQQIGTLGQWFWLDKQLDWYERAAQAIFGLAEKIQIADTFQSDHGTAAEELKRLWGHVQGAHLTLIWVSQDSRLFASRKAMARMDKIALRVQKLADQTDAFDPPTIKDPDLKKKLLQKIYDLSLFLEKAAPPLLAEGRSHLGIDRKPILSVTYKYLSKVSRDRARRLRGIFEVRVSRWQTRIRTLLKLVPAPNHRERN
jgi:hypothetical protein